MSVLDKSKTFLNNSHYWVTEKAVSRFIFILPFCKDVYIVAIYIRMILYTAELAQKARKEIADYINNGKDERARIRVSTRVCP